MEDTISNPSMESLLFSIDNTISDTQQRLKLLVDDDKGVYRFERGPRYGEYSRLRESKLRMKRDFEKILKEEQVRFGFTRDEDLRVLPEKKKNNRFGFNPNPKKQPSSYSSLAQSVPDFSSMIRKENHRPLNSNLLPRRTELITPPSMKSKNAAFFSGSVRGSVSASGGDKKRIGLTRKSYANVDDLKKISIAAASAINGGGGGGRKSLGGAGGGGGGRKSLGGGCGGRTILGYRHIY